MDVVGTIFTNVVFLAAMAGFFSAQGYKVIMTLIKSRKFEVERIIGSGGMPSSHTASIVAATFAAGNHYGFAEPLFGLGLVISFIVMYDAAGVRMAAGKQAMAINKIIEEIGEQKFNLEGELKELLGHTYMEVFVGMILGIVIGLLM